jgi:glycosyltransferase involved in cell wall biosynthesis
LTDRGDTAAGHDLSVLLVNEYYAPAEAPTARLLADVGSGLADRGHDVAAVCSRRDYRDPSVRYDKREVVDGVDVRRVRTTALSRNRRWGRIVNYVSFIVSATSVVMTTRKPDVVVCLTTPPLLASILQLIASIRGIRMVYWVMDVHPELAFRLGQLSPTSFVGRLLEAAARIPLARADAVVVLGEDMARHLKRHANGNLRVIRNWADGTRIRPAPKAGNTLRDEWGWNGRFIVAYSGNMGLVHEFDTILEAAARLQSDDRYLFCFIGDGVRRDDVETEAERLGLRNVEFRAYVPAAHHPEALTAPDLHVVSLRSDLAGLSVPSKTYSILAAGKPIAFVGPGDSDVAAVVKRGRCGFHVANGDVDGLVDAIRDYGGSAERLAAHQAAARRAFEESFTRESGLELMTAAVEG